MDQVSSLVVAFGVCVCDMRACKLNFKCMRFAVYCMHLIFAVSYLVSVCFNLICLL